MRQQPIVERPNIIPRQAWGAKPPLGEMKLHHPDYITIHHSAAPQEENLSIEQKMQNLQNLSQTQSQLSTGKLKPAWPDVPYHFYIGIDGRIAEGRDIHYAGDTNTQYDPTGHLLIVLEGNLEIEQPSYQQLQSLTHLVCWLALQYRIPVNEIKGHKDYADTACPGKNLVQELVKLRENMAGKPISIQLNI